jgi:hypothetical protein
MAELQERIRAGRIIVTTAGAFHPAVAHAPDCE